MEVKNNLFFPINRFILVMILTVTSLFASAQALYSDSLSKILSTQNDTLKVKTLLRAGNKYSFQNKKDTALAHYLGALKISEESNDEESKFLSLQALANFYEDLRKMDLALEFALKAKKIAEKQRNNENLFNIVDLIGGYIYFNSEKYELSLDYGIELQKIAAVMKDEGKIAYAQMYMGDVYRVMKKFDAAINIYSEALKRWSSLNDSSRIMSSFNNIGVIYDAMDNYEMSKTYYLKALQMAEMLGYPEEIAEYSSSVASSYYDLKNYEQSLLYAEKSRVLYDTMHNYKEAVKMYSALADLYVTKGDYKKSYYYLAKYRRFKDSLAFTATERNIDSLQAKYESDKVDKQFELIRKESATQAKLRNLFIAVSGLLIIIAGLIANRYRAKKKSEDLLNNKNAALTKTLAELESTQAQLIQSAKMASLGELTAGIAHEIQNPLNFVNNFSEVNTELIDEMQELLKSGKDNEAIAISNDIKENEQKINYHGKRADSIVKGMLQHSRSSSGKKELTDINALADEYLRLAYHGLRARDHSFNAITKTDFDNSIGNINIITQDIGRVILNLFTNAFYAISEKKKKHPEGYEPTVLVSTRKSEGKIKISVKDNGEGIPENLIDKIFQPFFTTKPTGQGTGLGLSLSYDIVKTHGGELKVESKENEGAVFIIQLPL